MSNVERLFGSNIWPEFQDRTVVDFGCGDGPDAIAIAQHGARHVYGFDIRESVLKIARNRADTFPNLTFTTDLSSIPKVDIVLSIDGFEHFDDPEGALAAMKNLLQPNGKIIVSFGYPWYHPFGGHCFSFFPWSHVLLPESFLCWLRTNGRKHFHEVPGGLNQMSIRRFERIVSNSGLRCERLDCVPIGAVRWLHSHWTREVFTSVVQCELIRRTFDCGVHRKC